MTTLRILAQDFLTSFKQTNPEKNVTLPQVVHWAIALANNLKSLHIQKRDSKSFVHIFPELPVSTETTAATDSVPGRKFITLPGVIYNFNDDRGIDYIAYGHDSDICGRPGYTFNTFTRTTAAKAARLYLRESEKPSIEQPYFLPMGAGKIYLLGLEFSDIETVEAGLFTAFDPLQTIDIDEQLDFPDETIQILIRQLYDLGRWGMFIPKDLNMNSVVEADPSVIASQKLTSVNDPNINIV